MSTAVAPARSAPRPTGVQAAQRLDGLEQRLRQAVRARSASIGRPSDRMRTTPPSIASYRSGSSSLVTPRMWWRRSEYAGHLGAPVLPRGCGTSLAGQCCNFAVVFDFSKYMNRILELDPERRIARVQPGVICDELRDAAEQHHLTLAPDPATHDHCTLGGMIGNNSCGTHSVMGGKTVDNVVELDVLLYDGTRLRLGSTPSEELRRIIAAGGRRGQIYRDLLSIRDRYGDLVKEKFPDIPRRVSGYNLDSLFDEKGFHVGQAVVGSEGTCVIVLEATMRLVPSPPKRTLVVLGYPDVPSAGRAVPTIMEHGPIALEHFNRSIVNGLHKKGKRLAGEGLLPDGEAWLLVEFGGETQEKSESPARRLMSDLRGQADAPSMKLYDKAEEESEVWEIRRSSVGASRVTPFEHGGWPNWEDAAVPVACLGDYLEGYIEVCRQFGYHPTFYGHFGQGCVHSRLDFQFREAAGIGLDRRRSAPSCASTTFARWWEQRGGARHAAGPPVVLWPDTFTNYFHPHQGIAAVAVLEAAGYRVIVPSGHLCCGRPLFDYGMVKLARRMLGDVIASLRPHLRAGVQVVGLEPSCTASFRDEVAGLFPDDEDARKLSLQARSLAEFIQEHPDDFSDLPHMEGGALFHGHCHQKALWGDDADKALLRKLGLEVTAPDAGCCGLAGSFGYERGEKFEVADRAGERVLAPAVREAGEASVVVADGFSCQSPVAHLTRRRPLHLAEVLHLAMLGGLEPGPRPEERYGRLAGQLPSRFPTRLLMAGAGAGTIAAGALLRRSTVGSRR